MDLFDSSPLHGSLDTSPACDCTPDLTNMLTVAHVSQGMDPLQAALEAQLQTPLLQPFLF